MKQKTDNTGKDYLVVDSETEMVVRMRTKVSSLRMKARRQRTRQAAKIITVDRRGLERLIDDGARVLGLSGQEALRQIEKGKTGDNYVWTDLYLLAGMLPGNR